MREIDPALAHRLFYPGVPAVLAARSGETVSAMPIISYASLSARPPLVGVSCARGSFTLKLALASKAFSLCLLDVKRVRSVASLASRRGSPGADKLAAVGLKYTKGRKTSTPVLSGSVAALECSLSRRVNTGDHVFLVGRVEAAYASGDFQDYWRFRGYRPILYTGWQGGMSTFRSR